MSPTSSCLKLQHKQLFSAVAALLKIDFDLVLLFLGCWRVRLIRFGDNGVDSDGGGVIVGRSVPGRWNGSDEIIIMYRGVAW